MCFHKYGNGTFLYYLPFDSNLEFIQEVLQGAAVTLVELGDYARANSLLQDLAKVASIGYNLSCMWLTLPWYNYSENSLLIMILYFCRSRQVTLMFSVCLEKWNMNSRIMMEVLLPIKFLQWYVLPGDVVGLIIIS